MKILSAAEVDANLDDLALIDRLDALFRAGCEMPPRHHHTGSVGSRRQMPRRSGDTIEAGLN